MSVEQSRASSAPKSASSAQVAHVKGKLPAKEGGGLADTGGFSSLLMTLGADEAGDSGMGQDVSILPLVGDGEALLDPGLLLAQSMQLQPGFPKPPSAPGKGGLAAPEGALQAVKTGPQRGVQALPVEPAADQKVDKLLASADAVPEEMKELQQAPQDNPKPRAVNDVSKSVAGRLSAEEYDNKRGPADNRMAQSSALPQMVLAAGIGESGIRQVERATERSAFKQIGGSEGGAWGYQALAEAGRIDAPAPTTGASVLSPEMRVAEQVNFWIGRDIQNAELKLDGLGESPVKVSISLQGNEAHIEFRTDQAEARQVLEGAVSHLKDLLGSEGLVLSSVSVGSSGSGGDDPRDRKPPGHSRQVAVKVPETLVGEAALRPARLTGRTVDLFV